MAILNKNNFLIELSESPQTSFGRIDFESQTSAQRVFSTIWSVESEVNNGGFQQYFCNSSAETAHSLVGALIEIRAPRTAKICGKAIQLTFPKGMPKRFEDISAAASQMEEKTELALGKLDTEFCKYPHDLTELLYDFVISHPEEFAAPQRSSWFSSILQKFKTLLSV